MIAALYVESGGCYFGLPNVDPWDRERDARLYAGPHPVVAHPPCQRWGRYWHGSPRKPHQYTLGDDNGCFEAALASVRQWGGVLEHPAHSHAFRQFGILPPARSGGWTSAGLGDRGWVCQVEQAHYGHIARKATWLYTCNVDLPDLIWGAAQQRLPQIALDRYGYEKARRIGVMAYIGGKDKSKIRAATPAAFRDVLISIASSDPAAATPIGGMRSAINAAGSVQCVSFSVPVHASTLTGDAWHGDRTGGQRFCRSVQSGNEQ